MRRYTIKEIFEEKIAIWCTNVGQANKIWTAAGGYNNWDIKIYDSTSFEVFISKIDSQCPCVWQNGFNKKYFISNWKATQCIEFNQINFEEDTAIPEKWAIAMTPQNKQIIGAFFNENSNNTCYTSFDNGFIHSFNTYNDSILNKGNYRSTYHSSYIREGFKEITFEQFQKYVLMIVGYKAPISLFNDNIKKGELYVVYDDLSYRPNKSDSMTYAMPKEIVENWEAVYKENKKEYKIGDWVVIKRTGDICIGHEYIPYDTKVVQISYFKNKEYESPTTPKGTPFHKYYIGFNNNIIIYNAEERIDYILRKAIPEEIYDAQNKRLKLSNGEFVDISSNTITAAGQIISLNELKELTKPSIVNLNLWKVEVKDITYKIGCWDNVTMDDIKLIINTYNEINF